MRRGNPGFIIDSGLQAGMTILDYSGEKCLLFLCHAGHSAAQRDAL